MSEHHFFCGLEPRGRRAKGSRVLYTHGKNRNINLDKLTISRRLATTIGPRLLDLIDLGAYVFAADRLVDRGDKSEAAMGPKWRRRFNFEIAVRDPRHWSQPEIKLLLQELLGFMSEDEFSFQFAQSREPAPESSYFNFADDPVASGAIAPVLLFSGGLDSLAGALEELHAGRRRIVLVSHRSSNIVTHHQNELVAELQQRHSGRILHIPVKMTLLDVPTQEDSQRTRTFFFSCIAGAVAAAIGAPGIRFYENGIMSLNLPLSPQVVGTAATRSTHPRTLIEMTNFLQAAMGTACTVDNPFVLKTKAEVIQTLNSAGGSDLIDRAFTCTEIHWKTGSKSHCGTCIQCLHRQFGVLAAGLGEKDDAAKYALDLFESPREGQDRTMLVELIRRARQFHRMRDTSDFFSAFPLELSRLRGAMGPNDQVIGKMFELHRKFGNEIADVLEAGLTRYKARLAQGLMPAGSLLTFVVSEQSPSPGLPERPVVAPVPSGQIELMIDAKRGQYSINGRAPIRAKSSVRFLEILAEQHRAGAHAASSQVQFVLSVRLKKLLDCEQGSLGRLVERLRDRIEVELAACGLSVSNREIVIQSKQWDGYRLNPSIRLVTPPA